MGLATSADAAASAENSGPDETEDLGEDESIVHHTASIGDVEVRHSTFCIRTYAFKPFAFCKKS